MNCVINSTFSTRKSHWRNSRFRWNLWLLNFSRNCSLFNGNFLISSSNLKIICWLYQTHKFFAYHEPKLRNYFKRLTLRSKKNILIFKWYKWKIELETSVIFVRASFKWTLYNFISKYSSCTWNLRMEKQVEKLEWNLRQECRKKSDWIFHFQFQFLD